MFEIESLLHYGEYEADYGFEDNEPDTQKDVQYQKEIEVE